MSHRFIQAIAWIHFDEHAGNILKAVVPTEARSSCKDAWPCIIQRALPDGATTDGCHIFTVQNGKSWLWAGAAFSCVPDPAAPRGVRQGAVVVLSARPAVQLLLSAAAVIGEARIASGEAALEAAWTTVSLWSSSERQNWAALPDSPSEGMRSPDLSRTDMLGFALFGGVVEVPRTSIKSGVALGLFTCLGSAMPCAWLMWWHLVLGKVLVIQAKSAAAASLTACALANALGALKPALLQLPFATVFDPQFKSLHHALVGREVKPGRAPVYDSPSMRGMRAAGTASVTSPPGAASQSPARASAAAGAVNDVPVLLQLPRAASQATPNAPIVRAVLSAEAAPQPSPESAQVASQGAVIGCTNPFAVRALAESDDVAALYLPLDFSGLEQPVPPAGPCVIRAVPQGKSVASALPDPGQTALAEAHGAALPRAVFAHHPYMATPRQPADAPRLLPVSDRPSGPAAASQLRIAANGTLLLPRHDDSPPTSPFLAPLWSEAPPSLLNNAHVSAHFSRLTTALLAPFMGYLAAGPAVQERLGQGVREFRAYDDIESVLLPRLDKAAFLNTVKAKAPPLIQQLFGRSVKQAYAALFNSPVFWRWWHGARRAAAVKVGQYVARLRLSTSAHDLRVSLRAGTLGGGHGAASRRVRGSRAASVGSGEAEALFTRIGAAVVQCAAVQSQEVGALQAVQKQHLAAVWAMLSQDAQARLVHDGALAGIVANPAPLVLRVNGVASMTLAAALGIPELEHEGEDNPGAPAQ